MTRHIDRDTDEALKAASSAIISALMDITESIRCGRPLNNRTDETLQQLADGLLEAIQAEPDWQADADLRQLHAALDSFLDGWTG